MVNIFTQTQGIAAQGLRAYGEQLKTISQNLANVKSTPSTPGELPYARQSLVLGEKFNKQLGIKTVQVKKIIKDTQNFSRDYLPEHPAADENGFVLMPNVSPLEEMTDMMEATHNYQRILKVYRETTSLRQQTIGLLK